MAAPSIVPILNVKPRFFEGLGPTEVKTIVSAAKHRRYLQNSVIVNQGHPADYFFLLTSGRARYFYATPDGRKVILLWLPAGEIFGGAALLSRPSDYLVSTEAVMNCSVLVWDRATIRALVTRYPRLADNTLLIMFDYLAAYRAVHVSMTCHSARERLAQVLGHLATGIGQKVPGGIELDVRNEELANEANVTPFTASRLLREWQRQGILRKSRGKVLLRAPERLFVEET
ncbi:MAG TPA: Crp/Fnr family transcriptional regulator [Terriglobales bacterium]